MNSFWKLKPLIDDDGGISPAGLIYPGIWVPRKTVRGTETGLLPAADYHPGMFIKSYDSFRQFLSFFRLKVRLGCRSPSPSRWPRPRPLSPVAPSIDPAYISSISFISSRNSLDTLGNSSYRSYVFLGNTVESTSPPRLENILVPRKSPRRVAYLVMLAPR